MISEEQQRIVRQFDAKAVCKHFKQRPTVTEGDGTIKVGCSRGESCKCVLEKKMDETLSGFLGRWLQIYAKRV